MNELAIQERPLERALLFWRNVFLGLARALGPGARIKAGRTGDGWQRTPRLFRVILPAGDMETSVRFYRDLLALEGERVSPGRHYFDCGGVILAVVDSRAEGDHGVAYPNADHLYLAVGDLEAYHRRAVALRAVSSDMGEIETRPWGERSFYLTDPLGNPICFVDEKTLYLGSRAPRRAESTDRMLAWPRSARRLASVRVM